MNIKSTINTIGDIDLLAIMKSDKTAIWLAIFLVVLQAFHSAEALIYLTTLPAPLNYMFAIPTALLVDGLLIWFVARGAVWSSSIVMLYCISLNVLAFHIGGEYWTYKSFYSFVPAIFIPLMIHVISHQMSRP
jgi:hypothetical protein